jgi:hypothetical protein
MKCAKKWLEDSSAVVREYRMKDPRNARLRSSDARRMCRSNSRLHATQLDPRVPDTAASAGIDSSEK